MCLSRFTSFNRSKLPLNISYIITPWRSCQTCCCIATEWCNDSFCVWSAHWFRLFPMMAIQGKLTVIGESSFVFLLWTLRLWNWDGGSGLLDGHMKVTLMARCEGICCDWHNLLGKMYCSYRIDYSVVCRHFDMKAVGNAAALYRLSFLHLHFLKIVLHEVQNYLWIQRSYVLH